MTGARAFAILVLAGIVSGPARAADPPYLSDLPKLFPKIHALWTASLPRSVTLPPWMRRFDGTVTPIRDVTIDGQAFLFGTSCMPHDCGSNMLGVLFSPQRNTVVGLATLSGNNEAPTTMVIGDVNARQIGCIRFLTDQYQATDCSPR